MSDKETAVNEVSAREEAVKIVSDAIEHYVNSFCK